MAQVTTLYFERRHRQILQRLAAPTNLRERLTLILEIERLTAEIDALTGGWFAMRIGGGGGGARR
jgi:hypothetical protein